MTFASAYCKSTHVGYGEAFNKMQTYISLCARRRCCRSDRLNFLKKIWIKNEEKIDQNQLTCEYCNRLFMLQPVFLMIVVFYCVSICLHNCFIKIIGGVSGWKKKGIIRIYRWNCELLNFFAFNSPSIHPSINQLCNELLTGLGQRSTVKGMGEGGGDMVGGWIGMGLEDGG